VRANKVRPLDEEVLVDLLQKAMWHMERPYFNSVPLVHTLLMRKARSEGVTVVLNGHGPDEMFAGYPASYIPAAIGDSIRKLRWGEAWREATAMRDIHGLARRRALQRGLWGHRAAARRAGDLSSDGLALLEGDVARAVAARAQSSFGSDTSDGLDRELREDFFRRSLPAWLHLEDRISMSQSIEARLPFLDYRMVEFAFTLPNEFKISRGITKRVLREAMRGQLPASILSSTRKVPFSGPDAAWIRGPLRQWIERSFFDERPRIFDYLRAPAVRDLLQDFLNSAAPRSHQYQVWKIVSTELWLRSV
jgi:asparagine synthase (glutamine-hydrolysing)